MQEHISLTSRPARRAFAAIAALCLAAAPLSGCGLNPGQKNSTAAVQSSAPEQAVSVGVAAVTYGVLPGSQTYTGTVVPGATVQVASKVAGRVTETMVKVGDHVTAGQPLAKVDTSAVQQQLAVAQSAVRVADAQYAKAEQDLTNAASTAGKALELQQAQAAKANLDQQNAVKQAEQALAVAQAQLDKAKKDKDTAINQAKQAVAVAQAQMNKAVADNTSAQAAAQTAVDATNQTLTAAQQAVDNATAQLTLQLSQAYTSWNHAVQAYDAAVAAKNTAQLPTLQAAIDTSEAKVQLIIMQLGQADNSINPAVAQASAQYQAALTQLASARNSQAITVAQEQVNLQKITLEAAQSASTAVIEQQVGQTALALNSVKAVQPAAAAIVDAQLAQAEQTVQNAQATAALDVIDAQRRQGLVNVQILQDQLKDGLLFAPAEGTVAAVLVPAGQNATAQTPVISIVSTTPVYANINVPEQEIAGFQAGSNMNLHIPAIPFTGPAVISGIKPGIDASTKTYTVVLELEQPDAGILPGMFAQAIPEKTSGQSITVPADAVLKQTDGTYAVYIVQENRAIKKNVQLGTLTGSRYEITAGLDIGDQLIVKGQTFVSDKTLVQVVKGAGDGRQAETQP